MHKIAIDPVMLERGRTNRNNRDRSFTHLDMKKVAHVVIDMQTAYLQPGSRCEVPIAREIVPNVNAISEAVRQGGGLNVFIRKTFNPNEAFPWNGWYSDLLGDSFSTDLKGLLTPGSETHELWPEIDAAPGEQVVNKTRFSAFTHGTCDLHDLLQERGIDTVIITGTLTNFCSESSARDANQLNYKVIFVSDGNAALTDEEHNATLGTLYTCWADVISTEQVIELIASSSAKRDAAA
ncbi:isochorismatase family cysteine hydrolase [Rhizobium sp. Root1204]|uniref:cysteine hydrolase family protein n=1 Tax=Rhizobium sp. Root1204 TaxID=1736428 RepID=UPI0007125984|nr:isochorismatase family cysteine hydrolase [Rhizobium sp. Root1204]KQV41340.1 hypothetical protein ASC96_18795 [Rhizobium sp. Root1204]